MSQYFWNSALDENNHAFVGQYGESIVELLAPQAGEQILDLGCSTGQLTERIYQKSRACVQDIDLSDSSIRSAFVQGIDLSDSSIDKAKETYPHIEFYVADATENFPVKEPLDAVFSKDVLHWIKEPYAVINCVKQALKPGGRFVAEFNGKGSVEAIVGAVLSVLSEIRGQEPEALNPWYCPSIGEYAGLLEN